MTELIVRELRLRAYDGLGRAASPRQSATAGRVTDVDVHALQDPGVDRLALQYSRRRVRRLDLEL